MSEGEAKLWHRVQRNEFRDMLRHAHTRQGRFEDAALHLDHPLPGTTRLLAPSDRGAGARRIRAAAERIDGHTKSRTKSRRAEPLWRRLWCNAEKKLTPTQRRVLHALMDDWRSRPAARIAGVDHKTVDRCRTFFKVHFAQCFQAYKRRSAVRKFPAFKQNYVMVYGGCVKTPSKLGEF